MVLGDSTQILCESNKSFRQVSIGSRGGGRLWWASPWKFQVISFDLQCLIFLKWRYDQVPYKIPQGSLLHLAYANHHGAQELKSAGFSILSLPLDSLSGFQKVPVFHTRHECFLPNMHLPLFPAPFSLPPRTQSCSLESHISQGSNVNPSRIPQCPLYVLPGTPAHP